MADFAHEKTDEGLEELKKKIRKEYKKAAKEIARKYEAYMNRFADLDKANKQKVIRGEMTKKQYDLWRTNAIATGKRWKQFQDTIATDLTLTDVKAMSMTQGFMPEAYALNYNFGEYEIETQLKDTDKAKLNGSFVLMDSDTAELMIRDNPELLPKPTVNIPKDKKWNADKIHSAMTQGLLQGESNQAIAKRLMHVVGMGANSAIRNARTMTTCAENMGRENSYKRAQKMGIPITREWLATTDERTRSSHMAVNGQRRPIGKKFSNGCMFPGDPSAPGYEIYNCRCTLIASVYGIDYNKSDAENIRTIKGYAEWEEEQNGLNIFNKIIGKRKATNTTPVTKDLDERLSELKESIEGAEFTDMFGETINGFELVDALRTSEKYNTKDNAIDNIRNRYFIKKPELYDIEGEVSLFYALNDAKAKGIESVSDFKDIAGHDNMSFMQKLKDVITNANQEIDGEPMHFNCQRVVVATEARWRGKNVVAKERLFTRGNGSAHESIAMEQVKYGWANCFRDKNGQEGRRLIEKIDCDSNKEYYNEISKRMKKYGDGSRAIISIRGHVYSCVQNGDETVFYDAQARKRHKKQNLIDIGSENFIEKSDGTVHLLRVDNLEFTENALVAITEGK